GSLRIVAFHQVAVVEAKGVADLSDVGDTVIISIAAISIAVPPRLGPNVRAVLGVENEDGDIVRADDAELGAVVRAVVIGSLDPRLIHRPVAVRRNAIPISRNEV